MNRRSTKTCSLQEEGVGEEIKAKRAAACRRQGMTKKEGEEEVEDDVGMKREKKI